MPNIFYVQAGGIMAQPPEHTKLLSAIEFEAALKRATRAFQAKLNTVRPASSQASNTEPVVPPRSLFAMSESMPAAGTPLRAPTYNNHHAPTTHTCTVYTDTPTDEFEVGYIQPYGLAPPPKRKRKRAPDWSQPGQRNGERIWNVYGVKGSREQDTAIRMLESELPAAFREDLTFLKADFQRLIDMGYDPRDATSDYMRRPANKKLPRKTAMVGSRRRLASPQVFVTEHVAPPHSGSILFAMSESVGVRLDQPAAALPPLQFHDLTDYCVPYCLFNLVPLSDEAREHIMTGLGAFSGKRCDVEHLLYRRKKDCGWSVENLRRPKIATMGALYAYTQTKQARRRKFMVMFGTHAVGIDVKRGYVFDPAETHALPLTLASLVACGMGEDELDVWVVLG